MKSQKHLLHTFTALLLLFLQACNLPNAQTAEPTEIDPDLAVQLTLTALAPSPTVQLFPTNTQAPTLTPTLAVTNTPAATSTPTFAYVTLSEATNCRKGAGTTFELVDTFVVGQTIAVVGKHPFDDYWYVQSPNNASVYCWMWGFYATGGNLGNVPVLTPPPTYTVAPQPSFDATYVDSGKCLAWYSRISLKNTGPVTLKSISMTITDTVTAEARNFTGNGFQDVNACVLSAANPTLAPGATYTVVAPSLSADHTGHRVTLAITLCTENNQTGVCASKTIEFTP